MGYRKTMRSITQTLNALWKKKDTASGEPFKDKNLRKI